MIAKSVIQPSMQVHAPDLLFMWRIGCIVVSCHLCRIPREWENNIPIKIYLHWCTQNTGKLEGDRNVTFGKSKVLIICTFVKHEVMLQ